MSALQGGRVNYYLVEVQHPQREDQAPYRAECEDIADALQLTPNEFCEFKAIWRTAAARLGNGKPDQKALYDAQKRVHYATRDMLKLQREADQVHTPVSLRDDIATRKAIFGDDPIVYGFDHPAEPVEVVEGWIVANGKEMPDTLSNEQLVDVRCVIDGETVEYVGNFAKPAGDWIWANDGVHFAITHYRLTKLGDMGTILGPWEDKVSPFLPEGVEESDSVSLVYADDSGGLMTARNVDWANPQLVKWRHTTFRHTVEEDGWITHNTEQRPYGLGPNRQVFIRLSNGHEVAVPRKAAAWDWTYKQADPKSAPHIVAWKFAAVNQGA